MKYIHQGGLARAVFFSRVKPFSSLNTPCDSLLHKEVV